MTPLDPPRDRRPPRRPASPTGPLVVALVGGLVVGGLVGFLARGGGGTETVTVTTRAAVTTDQAATADAREARLRATRIAVLNGTSITGLAGRVADRARTLGWRQVEVGNGPEVTGRSEVYVRGGRQAAAELLATDLDALPPQPLPAGSPIASQFPRAQVVIVLGPEADVPPDAGTAGTAPLDTVDTLGTGPQPPPPEGTDGFSDTDFAAPADTLGTGPQPPDPSLTTP